MATKVETIEQPVNIRVALVIEKGRLKPVWFEESDKPVRDRIFIKKICSVWNHLEGAAKIVNFSVTDGENTYKLSLNTRDFTWRYAIAVETTYPTY